MDKLQDPEAAETVQTKSVPAVDLPSIVGRVAVLSVACNDEYGSPSSKADRIEVEWPEHDLTFGPVYADATARITWGKGWIRIAGIKINAVGPACHAGNIYWNAWHVRTDELWGMLTHRRFRKWFSLEEGECEVWEKYEADCPPNDQAHSQKGRERGPDNTQD
jgi:hypothetical protein